MHISNCLYPRLITNPATGEQVRVRCGKCSACQNAKAKNWINRLIEEASHHRYAFMVNLTYEDIHLPKMRFDMLGNLKFVNRDLDLCIPFYAIDEVINKSQFPERERYYLVSRCEDRLGLPVLCTDDIQKFNKRLNKYLHDKVTHQYGNFRYFICGEYGPGTYRPHYHAVYYFDRLDISACFAEAVHKAWSLGDTSVADIFSNGGFSYVAQYVNMSTHLPAVYSLKELRQRHTFSKCPPLGSGSLLVEALREIYDRKPIKRTVYDPMSAKYVVVPANITFKNRYFPKCDGYSKRSDSSRIALYRITEVFPSEDFRQFLDEVYSFYSSYKLYGLCPSKVHKDLLDYIISIPFHSKEMVKVEAKLYRTYLVSKRFCFIRDSLRLSNFVMLKHINDYYVKFDYERLKDFYQFQQDYTMFKPASDLIHMYPEFADLLLKFSQENKDLVSLPEYISQALFTFGLDWYCDFSELSDTFDFKTMRSISDKIYKDTHKAHDAHAYRYSQRFYDLNPQLQQILIKYTEYAT